MQHIIQPEAWETVDLCCLQTIMLVSNKSSVYITRINTQNIRKVLLFLPFVLGFELNVAGSESRHDLFRIEAARLRLSEPWGMLGTGQG